jgi:hypothetical protein
MPKNSVELLFLLHPAGIFLPWSLSANDETDVGSPEFSNRKTWAFVHETWQIVAGSTYKLLDAAHLSRYLLVGAVLSHVRQSLGSTAKNLQLARWSVPLCGRLS